MSKGWEEEEDRWHHGAWVSACQSRIWDSGLQQQTSCQRKCSIYPGSKRKAPLGYIMDLFSRIILTGLTSDGNTHTTGIFEDEFFDLNTDLTH